MAVIKVQKVPKKNSELSAKSILARFCYYFPQYTFSEARKLSFDLVKLMLKVADKEKATDRYFMCLANMAPHNKKPKEMLKYFKQLAES